MKKESRCHTEAEKAPIENPMDSDLLRDILQAIDKVLSTEDQLNQLVQEEKAIRERCESLQAELNQLKWMLLQVMEEKNSQSNIPHSA